MDKQFLAWRERFAERMAKRPSVDRGVQPGPSPETLAARVAQLERQLANMETASRLAREDGYRRGYAAGKRWWWRKRLNTMCVCGHAGHEHWRSGHTLLECDECLCRQFDPAYDD